MRKRTTPGSAVMEILDQMVRAEDSITGEGLLALYREHGVHTTIERCDEEAYALFGENSLHYDSYTALGIIRAAKRLDSSTLAGACGATLAAVNAFMRGLVAEGVAERTGGRSPNCEWAVRRGGDILIAARLVRVARPVI